MQPAGPGPILTRAPGQRDISNAELVQLGTSRTPLSRWFAAPNQAAAQDASRTAATTAQRVSEPGCTCATAPLGSELALGVFLRLLRVRHGRGPNPAVSGAPAGVKFRVLGPCGEITAAHRLRANVYPHSANGKSGARAPRCCGRERLRRVLSALRVQDFRRFVAPKPHPDRVTVVLNRPPPKKARTSLRLRRGWVGRAEDPRDRAGILSGGNGSQWLASSPVSLPWRSALGSFSPMISTVLPSWVYLVSTASRAATEEASQMWAPDRSMTTLSASVA